MLKPTDEQLLAFIRQALGYEPSRQDAKIVLSFDELRMVLGALRKLLEKKVVEVFAQAKQKRPSAEA